MIGIIGYDVEVGECQTVGWLVTDPTIDDIFEMSEWLYQRKGHIVIGMLSSHTAAVLFRAIKTGNLRVPVLTDEGELIAE